MTPKPLTPARVYALARPFVEPVVRRSYAACSRPRVPGRADFGAHHGLTMCDRIEMAHLGVLMSYVEPAARLRPDLPLPADGGAPEPLRILLDLVHGGTASADEILSLTALVKPYTAGNGRLGRALWFWRVVRGAEAEIADEIGRFLAGAPKEGTAATVVF